MTFATIILALGAVLALHSSSQPAATSTEDTLWSSSLAESKQARLVCAEPRMWVVDDFLSQAEVAALLEGLGTALKLTPKGGINNEAVGHKTVMPVGHWAASRVADSPLMKAVDTR